MSNYRWQTNGNSCAHCTARNGQVKDYDQWLQLGAPPLHEDCDCELVETTAAETINAPTEQLVLSTNRAPRTHSKYTPPRNQRARPGTAPAPEKQAEPRNHQRAALPKLTRAGENARLPENRQVRPAPKAPPLPPPPPRVQAKAPPKPPPPKPPVQNLNGRYSPAPLKPAPPPLRAQPPRTNSGGGGVKSFYK